MIQYKNETTKAEKRIEILARFQTFQFHKAKIYISERPPFRDKKIQEILARLFLINMLNIDVNII